MGFDPHEIRRNEYMLKIIPLILTVFLIIYPWVCSVPAIKERVMMPPFLNSSAFTFVAAYGGFICLMGLILCLVLEEESHTITIIMLLFYSFIFLCAAFLMIIEIITHASSSIDKFGACPYGKTLYPIALIVCGVLIVTDLYCEIRSRPKDELEEEDRQPPNDFYEEY